MKVGCLVKRPDGTFGPLNRAGRSLLPGKLVFGRDDDITQVPHEGSLLAGWRLPSGDLRPAYLHAVEDLPDGDRLHLIFVPEATGAPVTAQALHIGLGLTRAEAGLTAHLTRGRKVGEAAKHLGLSEQTVRTYLKRIFSKLGVSGQSELVALALAQSVPLVEGPDDTV